MPGAPAMAVPSAWGAAKGVVPASAGWGALGGAVQLGGVDSPPIEFAPPAVAVTPLRDGVLSDAMPGEAMPPVCAAAASAEPPRPATSPRAVSPSMPRIISVSAAD